MSQAVWAAPELNLKLLDNRAAAYEKLGNLKDALADGRSMILHFKARVEGYLRTGKVLELGGKPELALKIYERGLHVVDSKAVGYAVGHLMLQGDNPC
ncbi:hypothetical protein MRB53_039832 [Persea americana]|nr:hypothetical protein MRB53_039832 [Persea americana]